MAFLPAVTTVLVHQCAWIPGLNVMLLVQGRGEMAVLNAVTAVLLHQNALDTCTDCNVFSTG